MNQHEDSPNEMCDDPPLQKTATLTLADIYVHMLKLTDGTRKIPLFFEIESLFLISGTQNHTSYIASFRPNLSHLQLEKHQKFIRKNGQGFEPPPPQIKKGFKDMDPKIPNFSGEKIAFPLSHKPGILKMAVSER